MFLWVVLCAIAAIGASPVQEADLSYPTDFLVIEPSSNIIISNSNVNDDSSSVDSIISELDFLDSDSTASQLANGVAVSDRCNTHKLRARDDSGKDGADTCQFSLDDIQKKPAPVNSGEKVPGSQMMPYQPAPLTAPKVENKERCSNLQDPLFSQRLCCTGKKGPKSKLTVRKMWWFLRVEDCEKGSYFAPKFCSIEIELKVSFWMKRLDHMHRNR